MCMVVVATEGTRHSDAVDAWTRLQQAEPSGFIAVEAEDDGHVLRLIGDVDASVVTVLTAEHALDDLRIVAVDVRELAYIDSTGLTLLVRWAQEAHREGRPAVIRHPTKRFERVLDMAGLTPLFELAS
jgi:anti-anti-sigma factor